MTPFFCEKKVLARLFLLKKSPITLFIGRKKVLVRHIFWQKVHDPLFQDPALRQRSVNIYGNTEPRTVAPLTLTSQKAHGPAWQENIHGPVEISI